MSDLFLPHLAAAVKTLLDTAGGRLVQADEDEREFTWSQPSAGPPDLARLAAFSPYLDLLTITVRYTLQQWQGSAQLYQGETGGVLKVTRASQDPALTPEPIRQDLLPLYTEVADCLGRPRQEVDLDWLAPRLAELKDGGASLDLSWDVYMNKSQVLSTLAPHPAWRCVFYVLAEKLQAYLENKPFTALEKLWNSNLTAGAPGATLILLGSASGQAGSPGVQILGLDEWRVELFAPPTNERFEGSYQDALAFCRDEADWEMAPTSLTPYQFYLQTARLSHPGLIAAFNRLCAQACVAYLANRVSLSPGQDLLCEFHGQQRLKVQLSPFLQADGAGLSPTGLFNLFTWAYENSSSDKLNIARQIIAYQLGDDSLQNFTRLCARAGDILQNAKDNFQYYLRKGVEEYFARRLKLVEFVEKFGEDTGEAVSKLTSDLIGDLYKTVGVILGVVLAALLSPHSTPAIIHWTSLLYLLYILFILVYALPSLYLRFSGSVRHYENSKNELRGILSAEEIQKTGGQSYNRALWLFRIYFALTSSLYAILAALAYLLFRSTV